MYEGSTKNTVWINDGNENKLISRDNLQDFLEKGYYLGQVKDRVMVHNQDETKRVKLSDLDFYLSQGFILGSGLTSNMFGKKWVCKDDKFIVIDASELESYLKDGWQNGRPIAASKGKIWIHKDDELTYIDPCELEDYIEQGWHAGKTDEKFFINNGVESKYVNGDEYKLYYKDWKLGTATRGRVSSVEIKFKDLLEENDIKYEMHFYLPSESRKYYFDFKVGNILIELNPTITHNSTWAPFGDTTPADYHYLKTKAAVEKGYQCINIWDWDNIDVLLSLLKPRRRVYARKCELKEVNKKEAEEFINKNHFQGYARDSVRLGLYHSGSLVSIMTFGKPRYNKKYEYELIRYCSNCEVVGGAEKLFTNFKRMYNPQSIISYCDMSKFTGKTYEKLGFKDDGFSIGKHWYNMKSKKHITDNLLRQQGFDRLFGTSYGKGTSNEQLMLNAGFLEIYDCGQRRWRIRYECFNYCRPR